MIMQCNILWKTTKFQSKNWSTSFKRYSKWKNSTKKVILIVYYNYESKTHKCSTVWRPYNSVPEDSMQTTQASRTLRMPFGRNRPYTMASSQNTKNRGRQAVLYTNLLKQDIDIESLDEIRSAMMDGKTKKKTNSSPSCQQQIRASGCSLHSSGTYPSVIWCWNRSRQSSSTYCRDTHRRVLMITPLPGESREKNLG